MFDNSDFENDNNLLCDLNFHGYRLVTYDLQKVDRMGKSKLSYYFYDKTGKLLFSGSDFACSPCHAIDSLETCTALLGFLTLRIGDTDREYFQFYTKDQLDFANSSDCESMQAELSMVEESDCEYTLEDILKPWDFQEKLREDD